MIVYSFIFFLVLMAFVGVMSSFKSSGTTSDYILADRSIGPFSTALSAVSTCHSGFMFIGMIGYTYTYGLSAIWLIISWVIGDTFAWKWIYPKVRIQTEEMGVSTVSGFISHSLTERSKRWIQCISGIFIIIFLAVYAAAQLTAGSKALTVMIGWHHTVGILIGAIVVVLYSASGGIRASIWTDVVSSIIMMLSMMGLCFVALQKIGGYSSLIVQLSAISSQLVAIFPDNLMFGFGFYFFGWIAFGFGVVGQPHVISRTMAIKKPQDLSMARNIYLIWYVLFSISVIIVGLSARVILPELSLSDSELALPLLSMKLLPSVFVGGILAGLFSATISTADSQILTCSSIITQDLFPSLKFKLFSSKVATVFTMVICVLIALFGSDSVYILVILAWSSLAAIFTPLIVCHSRKIRLNFSTTLFVMIVSFVMVVFWNQGLNFSNSVNEVLPAFFIAFIGIGCSMLLTHFKN